MPVDTPTEALSTTVIDRGVLATSAVVARVHRIQEVMGKLMKKDVHFGQIPGTPKPTLYKPGAELLLMTFRIAASPSNIEDLSTSDEIRYRVTVRGTNQVSGEIVGEMVGECSSSEEKYRWRKPVCDEEWAEAEPMHRREKWKKANSNAYKEKQVRTSPADVANTILKMAVKRAMIAMTLVSLGASDIFAQDLEDLAEELRESIVTEPVSQASGEPAKQVQRASAQTGSRPAAAAPSGPVAGPKRVKAVRSVSINKGKNAGKTMYVFVLDGDPNEYTTFDQGLAAETEKFVGTDHKITLAYDTNEWQGKTYYNAKSLAIADVPADPPAAAPPDAVEALDGNQIPFASARG